MKDKLFNILLLVSAFLITCGFIAFGDYFRAGFQVKPGEVWVQPRLVAPTDVENRIATERNRLAAEALAANLLPIVALDSSVQDHVEENLDALFVKLSAIRESYQQETEARQQAVREAAERAEEERRRQETAAEQTALESAVYEDGQAELSSGGAAVGDLSGDLNEDGGMSDVQGIPLIPLTDSAVNDNGVTPEEPEPYAAYEMFSTLSITFTEAQQEYLLTMREEAYLVLKEQVYAVTGSIMDQGVQELDNKTFLAVRDEFNKTGMSEEPANIGYEIVSNYLGINEFENEEQTLAEKEAVANDYERVMILKDETIIDENERVSEEDYAILESLGFLSSGIQDKIIPMVGVFMLVAAVFAVCVLYLGIFRKKGFRRKDTVLLITLYSIVLFVVWALGDIGYPFLPLLLFAMLVAILMDVQTAVILSLGMTVLCYFVVNGSIDYWLFYLSAGPLVCLLAKFTTERTKVFMVGLLATVVNFLLSCAISLIIEKNNAAVMWESIAATGGIAAINGLLTVIICTGSLPLWEALFGVVTPIKLLDLTNPTNLLLRRLTIEAPGTYHHSLIVANLAESAAYDIGAHPGTARAAAYYHDIGKLKYPQYFAENLAGENPHDSMDPFNSVQIIVSHVSHGLTLADEYRLPQFIRDTIEQHHGCTLIYYFYRKAKDEAEANGQTIDEKDFRYPFTMPQTREAACVMLADTVEAAVRSMISRVKSIDEVESQIKQLIRDKLLDGQLAESGLSIKDVDTIAASFFRVLKGMYHERIPYPKHVPAENGAVV